jgi:uncharacterized protein
MSWMRWAAVALMIGWVSPVWSAGFTPPAKPARYFNDYANLVPAAVAQDLNAKLDRYERETSNQVLVAIFSKIPEGTYLEEFADKTFQAWAPGTKEQDNGIILFVFVADRKMRIEVGYGLKGKVPDSVAANIIRNEIEPNFKRRDFAGGLTKGVDAILAAAKGEYEGTGSTIADARGGEDGGGLLGALLPLLFFFGWVWVITWLKKRQTIRRGYSYPYSTGGWMGGSGWSGGGEGGWSSGGGGGGFSGGGGSSGGGGASGGW